MRGLEQKPIIPLLGIVEPARVPVLKNIASLLTGNLGGQAITLIAAPMIARLYPPSEFGGMTTLWSVATFVGVISCLMYEKTIVIERDKRNAIILVSSSVLIAVLTSLATSACLAVFEVFVGPNYFGVHYAPVIALIATFCFGVKKTLEYYATREQLFSSIASSLVLGALAAAIWKLVGWKVGCGNGRNVVGR